MELKLQNHIQKRSLDSIAWQMDLLCLLTFLLSRSVLKLTPICGLQSKYIMYEYSKLDTIIFLS